jgi:hypothetical protein
MMVLGLLFCLTVIGAIIGLPMMLIGLVLVIAGRSNPSVVVQMNHHAPPHYPHAQPQYPPHPAYPPQGNLPEYGHVPQAPPLPHAAPVGPDGPAHSSNIPPNVGS